MQSRLFRFLNVNFSDFFWQKKLRRLKHPHGGIVSTACFDFISLRKNLLEIERTSLAN